MTNGSCACSATPYARKADTAFWKAKLGELNIFDPFADRPKWQVQEVRVLTPDNDPSVKTRGRIVGIPVPEDILPATGVGS